MYIYLYVCLHDVDSYVAFSSIYMHVSLFIYIYHIAKITSECVSVCVCLCACVSVWLCVLCFHHPHCVARRTLTHPNGGGVPSKKCPQLNMDNWYYNFPDKHLVYIMYDPYTHTPRQRHTLCISHSTREGHSMGNYLNVRSLCLIWHARSHMTSLTKLFELFGMCISAWKPIPKGIWRQKHRTAKKINIIYLKLCIYLKRV